MSDEQTGTLSTESGGESSQPVAPQETEDLIPTVDQAIPEPENAETDKSSEETQKTEGQTDEDEEKGVEPKDEGEEENMPFHEHPRFQELIREKNALKEQLAEIQTKTESKDKDAEEPEYQDMGAMSNEELQDMFDDDPKGFLTNFAKQIRSELVGEIQQQQREQMQQDQQRATVTTYEKYAKENPDFDKMWDDGKLQKFMDENPGHNAISAHMLLTKDIREKDAMKKAEEKLTKSLRAKRSAQVLSGGPSATGRPAGKIPAELQNTRKYGGLTSVLAQRAAQRLKGAP